MKLVISLFTAYITAFIITYGHAYQQLSSTFAGENVIVAFVSSIFWPLYWSVQVWK